MAVSNSNTYTQIHTIENCDSGASLVDMKPDNFAMKTSGRLAMYNVRLDKQVKIYLEDPSSVVKKEAKAMSIS